MKEENRENPKSSTRKPVSVGSIDLYTVQCVKCYKWRVIDIQEEYEEIRCNFVENPYKCSRKPGGSCDDPGDIEYDSSRTWVIDKPNLPKTPKGFKRSLVLRKDYSKLDAYYIASSGKKMRTRTDVATFLESNPELKEAVSIDQFSFHTPKVMEDTVPDYGKKGGGGGSTAEKKGSGGGSTAEKKGGGGRSTHKVKTLKDVV